MQANDGVIPSNIGLDGTVGGKCGRKWYGGTYGLEPIENCRDDFTVIAGLRLVHSGDHAGIARS